jgi:hypothetical protein
MLAPFEFAPAFSRMRVYVRMPPMSEVKFERVIRSSAGTLTVIDGPLSQEVPRGDWLVLFAKEEVRHESASTE